MNKKVKISEIIKEHNLVKKVKKNEYPIKEYDDKGNLIRFKNSNNFKYWYEYDDRDNLVHYKDSKGYEVWNEYDEKGNIINKLIHYSNGVWELNGEEYEVKKDECE